MVEFTPVENGVKRFSIWRTNQAGGAEDKVNESKKEVAISATQNAVIKSLDDAADAKKAAQIDVRAADSTPAINPKTTLFSAALEILQGKGEVARIQFGYLQSGNKAQRKAAIQELTKMGFSEEFIDAMKDGEITFKEFKKLGVDNETYYYWINSHCGQISTTDKVLTIDELVLIANEIKTLQKQISTEKQPISFAQLATNNEQAVAFSRVPLTELNIAKDKISKWTEKDLNSRLQEPLRQIVNKHPEIDPADLLIRILLASRTGNYVDLSLEKEEIEILSGLHRYSPSKITTDNILEWLETGVVSEGYSGNNDEAINRAARAIGNAMTATELNKVVREHYQTIKRSQQLIETVLEKTNGSARGAASITDNLDLAQHITKTVLAWLPEGQTKYDNALKLAVALAEKGKSTEAYNLIEENLPIDCTFKSVTDQRKGESIISGQLEARFIAAVVAGDTKPMDDAISTDKNIGLAHYYRAQTKVEEKAFDDYENAARLLTAANKETVEKRKECLRMMLDIYQTKASWGQNAIANKLKNRYNKLLKELNSGG